MDKFDIVKYIGKKFGISPNPGEIGIITDTKISSDDKGLYSIYWKDSRHAYCAWFQESEVELVKKFEWPSVT